MNRIGFVGLGSMGAPLAGRLLPGNQVYGTNRTRAKASALIERGLIAGLFQALARTAPAAAAGPGKSAISAAGAGPKAA